MIYYLLKRHVSYVKDDINIFFFSKSVNVIPELLKFKIEVHFNHIQTGIT